MLMGPREEKRVQQQQERVCSGVADRRIVHEGEKSLEE